MAIREPQLEIAARIGVTQEVDKLLQREKKKQKKSKAQLVCELVLEAYGDYQEK